MALSGRLSWLPRRGCLAFRLILAIDTHAMMASPLTSSTRTTWWKYHVAAWGSAAAYTTWLVHPWDIEFMSAEGT